MIGRTVSHYRVLEKVGEGGMGVVYKAQDALLNRTVALKFLGPRALGTPEERKNLIREAQAAAALDHPNICTVYEIGYEGDLIFISMAFLDGVSLSERIAAGMGTDEALRVAVQLARGLEAAHERGVIHRDIKSSNVIVNAKGSVRIMDFGLALMTEGHEPSAASEFAGGTPVYMAPEHLRREAVDPRSDIWSWGVVFYEMLTGRLPFTGNTPAELVRSILTAEPEPVSLVNSQVPAELDRIVARALAKRPDDRYPSMTEVLADLRSPGKSLGASLARSQPSIAVLPFVDMSPDGDQEHFCQGVAEEIITDLTHVEGLRVASRSSSFSAARSIEDGLLIGRQLGVATVLEGSVRKAGDQLRVTAQLVDIASGYHVWSARYDRLAEDVFAIQEEIAHAIVEALEVELSDTARKALVKFSTRNTEAHDYYLRGRQFFYRSNGQAIEYALEMFSRATEMDPDYARAHAGIADCNSYLFMYFGGDERHQLGAERASKRALELDPELAEAHAARGLALSIGKRYAEAERELEAAIALNPGLFEAYYFYARACFAGGDRERAAQLFEKASRVNPHDYQAVALLGFVYRELGLDEQSEIANRRALQRIERHVELNPDDARAFYLGATARVDLGDREGGFEWAERALSMGPDDPYNVYGIACFYSRFGEQEEGLRLFETALRAGFSHRAWIDNDGDLDNIRSHPRFAELLKRYLS